MNVQLEYVESWPLRHRGDCNLLGATGDGRLYVEEMYGDGWLAQHALGPDGQIGESVDEDGGAGDDLHALTLPADAAHSQPGWHSVALNFAGPRHRGLRDPERIADVVQPIAIPDKMRLVGAYRLPTTPPMLLGLAESFVLAEAPLQLPHLFVVCRRVRLAYALPSPSVDADDRPYDYDTVVLYAAHVYDRTRQPDSLMPDADASLPGVALHRPMDCLTRADRLYVADGGDETRLACIHCWQIMREPVEAPEDRQMRKLYG